MDHIYLGPKNVTVNYTSEIPLSQLYTGQSSLDKIRGYARYRGSPDIMVWEDFFNGDSVIQHYRQPYSKKIRVEGTDGFQFGTSLNKKSSLKYFDDFLLRSINLEYEKEINRAGVHLIKFKLNENKYARPDLFPDNTNCSMINISAVHKLPLFAALPHYSGCIL